MRRPRFIAAQARDARGLVGRIVAFIMARETWSQNLRAIGALDLQPADRVLDVGCGHGRSLGMLAARTPGGRVAGVDPSRLMARIARRRTWRLVASGRTQVRVASADALPFPDGAFDAVLCVHVLYFWDDLPAALHEIARVLAPDGRLALLFRTEADPAAAAFPTEIYRFPSFAAVVAALAAAGLSASEPDGSAEPRLLLARKAAP